ncbi:MAG TPA: D-Ala-D-Ala carboxypeptidase family metallohydrolase [Candidatus Saccharimonadales bacterium]|nr:D-Ala-D-Ala carboxypeptidase family metallohydrolase [Candidatus Saccharimonadales bacterium]
MPRTKDVSAAAAARLQQLLAGQDPTATDKYHAQSPEAVAYNVFGPQYAASLGRDTGVGAANILNTRAQGVEAANEQERYSRDLAAANAVEQQLQLQNQGYMLRSKILEGDQKNTDVAGMYRVTVDPTTGVPDVATDPALLAVNNAERLNAEHAGTLKDTAAAAKDLYGIGRELPDLGYMIAPAGQQGPTAIEENTVKVDIGGGQTLDMTASEASDFKKAIAAGDSAQAAMLAAKAAMYRAKHPSSSSSKVSIQYGPEAYIPGTNQLRPGAAPAVTTITTPGTDPPDYAPNPKADVHSGGTSAKPSAATLPPIDVEKVHQIGERFGTVTSTTRTKKHNAEVGGVKNSYHVDYGHGGHAVDIVPKRGVTKEQIAAEYTRQGYHVVESINEGDHIHTAFAEGPPQAHAAVQQRRPVAGGLQRVIQIAQARGYPHQMLANGIGVRITLPNGVTRIYNDQGRVQ